MVNADFTQFLSERRVVLLMIATILGVGAYFLFPLLSPKATFADCIIFAIGCALTIVLLGLLTLKIIEVVGRKKKYQELPMHLKTRLLRTFPREHGQTRYLDMSMAADLIHQGMIKSIPRGDKQDSGYYIVLSWMWKRLKQDMTVAQQMERDINAEKEFGAKQEAERQALINSFKQQPPTPNV